MNNYIFCFKCPFSVFCIRLLIYIYIYVITVHLSSTAVITLTTTRGRLTFHWRSETFFQWWSYPRKVKKKQVFGTIKKRHIYFKGVYNKRCIFFCRFFFQLCICKYIQLELTTPIILYIEPCCHWLYMRTGPSENFEMKAIYDQFQ